MVPMSRTYFGQFLRIIRYEDTPLEGVLNRQPISKGVLYVFCKSKGKRIPHFHMGESLFSESDMEHYVNELSDTQNSRANKWPIVADS